MENAHLPHRYPARKPQNYRTFRLSHHRQRSRNPSPSNGPRPSRCGPWNPVGHPTRRQRYVSRPFPRFSGNPPYRTCLDIWCRCLACRRQTFPRGISRILDMGNARIENNSMGFVTISERMDVRFTAPVIIEKGRLVEIQPFPVGSWTLPEKSGLPLLSLI